MVIATDFPSPGTVRVTDKYCSKTSQCIFRLMTQPEIKRQYNLFMHCTNFCVFLAQKALHLKVLHYFNNHTSAVPWLYISCFQFSRCSNACGAEFVNSYFGCCGL